MSRMIDLSHTVRDGLPIWPGDAQVFDVRTESTIDKNGCFARSFSMLEHYATHLDAPAHFVPGGATVDEIAAAQLMGPAAVIDVRDSVVTDADFALGAGEITRWEAAHGRIPPGAIVLLRTGWSARWPHAERYLNKDASGAMHFPGFGADAARALIERGVSAIGIDTMSVDAGHSRDFPVHRVVLQAGLYQLENLADLSAVPEAGASLLVAPIKLHGASGAPCRVFAMLP